jgi:hypothetical protein
MAVTSLSACAAYSFPALGAVFSIITLRPAFALWA